MHINFEERIAIEEFINHVFNYYNGRINRFNIAILRIEWLHPTICLGRSINPNIVTIYPNSIAASSCDIFGFYYIILETVIHELYHIDQNVDYARSTYDVDYRNQIESAVNIQSNIYIANNEKEIREEFGLSFHISYEKLQLCLNFYNDSGYRYFRRKYDDHLIILLNELIGWSYDWSNIYKSLRNNINTHIGGIFININGNNAAVQYNDKLMPINELNKFFYENCYKYNCRSNLKCTIKVNDGKYICINIEFKPMDIIAELIK